MKFRSIRFFFRPFAVSKFEVTFDQWDACFAAGGCFPILKSIAGRGDQPAINVTWHEAKQYVAWLNKMTGQTYRLLSEAEWEYAARAKSKSAYPWGDDIGKGNANCEGCGVPDWGGKSPAPVGRLFANTFHLYMSGNVWQWCEDNWHPDYEGAPKDGSVWRGGDPGFRVLRGGAWNAHPRSGYFRSAFRYKSPPDTTASSIGFRVGRTLTP